jgi:hypothetical protein
MKLSVLFIINAIVALLFGLGFVVIPATVLAAYSVVLPDAGLFIARLLGCAFLGYAIISWLVRNEAGSSTAVRAVVISLWVSDLLAFAFSLTYQLQGIANSLGWLTVALYLLLGLGFLYYFVTRKA